MKKPHSNAARENLLWGEQMGAIHYKKENGQFILADDCHVTEADSIEELDCSVRLYNLLKRNGYRRINQVTSACGMAFYEIAGISMKNLRELLQRLDFLGFRLADWPRNQPVEEYYKIYVSADEQRRAKEMAELDDKIRAERREKARIRARERRAKLRAARENPTEQGVVAR